MPLTIKRYPFYVGIATLIVFIVVVLTGLFLWISHRESKIAAFQMADLTLAPHTRNQFEAELSHEHHAYRNRAKAMLEAYGERLPPRQVPFPVQAIRFGEQVSLVALGGEVVVDYARRIKQEYASENLIVAGYSNDVMCYIPSVRILREGGYEAETSMVYYGHPGPFTEEVEETVIETVQRSLARVGIPPQDK